MSHVFHRNSRANPPVAVRGQGCYLIDDKGKTYLDASGGAAVSCLGHGNADVATAIKDQLDDLAYAHSSFFTTAPAEQLADLLCAHAPGLDKVYFVSGGSEAVEAAIKLARQYYVEIGQPQRQHIIARQQSYHGNTLGALSAGGDAWRRAQFAPLLMNCAHIAPCYAYRYQKTDETSIEYGRRAASELEAEILKIGPDNVLAFIAEPVVGATLGAVAAVPGYFKQIRQICDRYGVLLILDEVMCGMGRTGDLFAHHAERITPDILCIAKGLGAGYQPIGAMMCSTMIHQAIAKGSGFFQHGHTYMAHPLACAAGLAVVRAILDQGLLTAVQEKGRVLMDQLHQAFGQHPFVGDIRGRGLFVGIELVADRAKKTPFAKPVAAALKKRAFDEGLLCYPMSGTVDGQSGDHILLAPPFIISDRQIDELVHKLERSLVILNDFSSIIR